MIVGATDRHGSRQTRPRICGGIGLLSIAVASSVLLISGARPAHGASESQLSADAAAIASRLDPRVADTMARIPDLGRRLLALRSYLRAGSSLSTRWSWSEHDIHTFEQSQESRDAQAELDRVVAAFASAFPGYALYVNREVRSLELQIERWNENASVDAASKALLAELTHAHGPRRRSDRPKWLQRRLVEWTLAVPVTLAAPGLSAHGQSRAFDFQIERDGQLVAGTEAARAAQEWDAAGWTTRLRCIVRSTSSRLDGPLAAPHEPWHYVYEPDVQPPVAENVPPPSENAQPLLEPGCAKAPPP